MTRHRKKSHPPKKPPHLILILVFSLTVFCILTLTMLVVGTIVYILNETGVLHSNQIVVAVFMTALSSIVVGTVLSAFLGRIPLHPIRKLMNGLNALAAGQYQTRLHLGRFGLLHELEDSFNLTAEELQNTEMLRSDFVNHFSHEFKTPLVSMQGFARLLLREDLPKEKQREYLGIIASESARLAEMATKVLDLTRLENQSILTEVSAYNLSEQLRECLLLLERKWTEKQLEISADFAEYTVSGNAELLQQVWINLLDNAIKFATPKSTLEVSIRRAEETLIVSISDQGEVIAPAEQKRIFQKFYQSDSSHASQGNGIGLAIVRRIVELHGGEVQVESTEERTTFTVRLEVRNCIL